MSYLIYFCIGLIFTIGINLIRGDGLSMGELLGLTFVALTIWPLYALIHLHCYLMYNSPKDFVIINKRSNKND